jgi:hypothetical protein
MMNLYYAFAAGVAFTIAVEFILAWIAMAWSRRQLSRADVILQKYGSEPWAGAAGKPELKAANLQKIEDYIKEKFGTISSPPPTAE